MVMYLDSAIIVKLLVREHDSAWFEKNLTGHRFETSELALSEVCGALLFKERKNEIIPAERVRAMEKFLSMVEEEAIVLRQLDRKVIERAKGILMKKAGLDESEAFRRLQKLSRDQNQKMVEVGRMILRAEEAFRPL